MFVPAFVLSQPNFKVNKAPDLYLTEIYKRTILIFKRSGFVLKGSLHVCVARFVSIRTNFKPDLISFTVYIIPLSRLSQWLTILSQQLQLCPELLK